MLKYAKIINEQKQCEVGSGTDEEFYKSIGMIEMDVELAYDGYWYVVGYAPSKPIEVMQQEVRLVRNNYLEQYVDSKIKNPFMWDDLSEEDKLELGKYRKYLLDYTKEENWWERNPLTLEEWRSITIDDTISDTDDTI